MRPSLVQENVARDTSIHRLIKMKMISNFPNNLIFDDVFTDVPNITDRFAVHLKLEGLSIAGSIKIKPALYMIEQMEKNGVLRPGMSVIESSSGNLGIALSIVCAARGYPFICVSDPNISPQTSKLIEAYGAQLIIVDTRDINGGYLGTRISLIRNMLSTDSRLRWVNQYENLDNIQAHYHMTGTAILRQYTQPDYVFVGAGTTGTLGGVSSYLREHSPKTRIVAVDSIGSVTFGYPAGKRHIPGLGTSIPPLIRQHSSFDELVMISEEDAIQMCHSLAKNGLLLGGSSGTVLSAVQQLAVHIPRGSCVVAIAPDMGDRYMDTIYNPSWIRQRFPTLTVALSH